MRDAAGRRVAHIIGNSAYVSVPQLDNPANDAKAVAQQLRDFGFEVTLLLDLDKANFRRKMQEAAARRRRTPAARSTTVSRTMAVSARRRMTPQMTSRTSRSSRALAAEDRSL